MKFLRRLVLILAAILLLLIVVSLFMRSEYHAQSTLLIQAPPAAVFAVVDEVATWEDWTTWNAKTDASLKLDYSGPPRGVGATASWTSDEMGAGKRVVTVSQPNEKIVFELFFDDGGPPATGTLTFAAQDGGTNVTWAMEGDMGMMLPARFMIGLLEEMVRKDFETSLAALKQRCEKAAAATPTQVAAEEPAVDAAEAKPATTD